MACLDEILALPKAGLTTLRVPKQSDYALFKYCANFLLSDLKTWSKGETERKVLNENLQGRCVYKLSKHYVELLYNHYVSTDVKIYYIYNFTYWQIKRDHLCFAFYQLIVVRNF